MWKVTAQAGQHSGPLVGRRGGFWTVFGAGQPLVADLVKLLGDSDWCGHQLIHRGRHLVKIRLPLTPTIRR